MLASTGWSGVRLRAILTTRHGRTQSPSETRRKREEDYREEDYREEGSAVLIVDGDLEASALVTYLDDAGHLVVGGTIAVDTFADLASQGRGNVEFMHTKPELRFFSQHFADGSQEVHGGDGPKTRVHLKASTISDEQLATLRRDESDARSGAIIESLRG